MTFTRTNLNLIGPSAGNGPKLWCYTTTDNHSGTVDASGYFDNAQALLPTGDVIMVLDSDAPTIRFYRVTNTAGVITTTGLQTAA